MLDSSALVALLIDGGPTGDWVAAAVGGGAIAAPELAMYETGNILRRQLLAGRVDSTAASLAYQDMLALPVQLWPFAPTAERVWELRETITTYDASYVAVAELLEARLITLDERLARASGPTCQFLTPATT